MLKSRNIHWWHDREFGAKSLKKLLPGEEVKLDIKCWSNSALCVPLCKPASAALVSTLKLGVVHLIEGCAEIIHIAAEQDLWWSMQLERSRV